MTQNAAIHEPMPHTNNRPYVADLLSQDVFNFLSPEVWEGITRDIQARREAGMAKYGTALQPFNGRHATLDLYQELIDGAKYMRQRIYELDQEPTLAPAARNAWLTNYGHLLQLVEFVYRQLNQPQ